MRSQQKETAIHKSVGTICVDIEINHRCFAHNISIVDLSGGKVVQIFQLSGNSSFNIRRIYGVLYHTNYYL